VISPRDAGAEPRLDEHRPYDTEMRFSYAETFCDPTFLAPLARATEDAGYDSFVVPDSVIFPAESDTRYPYTPDGDRAFLEDKPIIEPFTLIPFLAAQTTRLRFTTFVLKLAIRRPSSSPSRPRASRC
jgi:alkanesulfonate monooxygenase SsuD/methylene tetrahydromethanopterin reductase-like flavin-dependent oxidoreductase (luciferase family)